ASLAARPPNKPHCLPRRGLQVRPRQLPQDRTLYYGCLALAVQRPERSQFAKLLGRILGHALQIPLGVRHQQSAARHHRAADLERLRRVALPAQPASGVGDWACECPVGRDGEVCVRHGPQRLAHYGQVLHRLVQDGYAAGDRAGPGRLLVPHAPQECGVQPRSRVQHPQLGVPTRRRLRV
ncbi:hypothetical protein LTR16_009738, partial [Cryomyces antarcticus]